MCFIQTFIDVVKQNDQCPHALHILIYKGSLINVLKAFLIKFGFDFEQITMGWVFA